MDISVIIPVYNAAPFVKKAVASAHHFDCVKEIVLIEDGSQDNSLAVCESIVTEFSKVKLVKHANNENKGAGASRNLGIQNAQLEWIAFLDADDVFLENRFDKELSFFQEGIAFDGVYGGLGVHYYATQRKEQFEDLFSKELTTVNRVVAREKLKYALLQMFEKSAGYFHLDAFTVRKSLIESAGFFNTKLRLHQDTDMLVKLSCLGNLIPGNTKEAVGLRGVHENNRITSTANGFSSRLLMYQELFHWFEHANADPKIIYKLRLDVLCYQFLCANNAYTWVKALQFTYKHAALFYNNRYFNLLINNANTSKKLKNSLIRAKEKFVLMFLKKKVDLYSIYVEE